MKLWICGQWRLGSRIGPVWDFQGIFSTEALAVAACLDETYFIGPATVDEPLPGDASPWPGHYYPKVTASQ
jgi:hypothetical protein